MSEHKPVESRKLENRGASILRKVESLVLFLLAVVLSILAILLLVSSVTALYQAIVTGQIRDQAIEILDSILLVMMTMEIVYTVTISIESHKLTAEPFLVVGAIAAIRRMLVITAESTRLEIANPEAFRSTLIELGLLAVTIIMISASIMILRRSRKDLPAGEE